MRRCLLVLLFVSVLSRAASTRARDFFDPSQRTLTSTAYVLAPEQWSVDAGLLGVDDADVLGRAALGYGLGRGFSLDSNFAHTGAGLLNLRGKWNFLDRPGFGLAAALSVVWGHGPWMWIFGRDLSDVNLVALPFSLFASCAPVPWLQLDLEVLYRHAEIFGDVESEALFIDSRLGLRSLSMRLVTRFYIAQKLELVLEATLPVYAALPGQLTTEAILAEGVRAGARVAGYQRLAFEQGVGAAVSVRSAIAKATFIQASLHYGKHVGVLYGHVVWPGLGLEQRF